MIPAQRYYAKARAYWAQYARCPECRAGTAKPCLDTDPRRKRVIKSAHYIRPLLEITEGDAK